MVVDGDDVVMFDFGAVGGFTRVQRGAFRVGSRTISTPDNRFHRYSRYRDPPGYPGVSGRDPSATDEAVFWSVGQPPDIVNPGV